LNIWNLTKNNLELEALRLITFVRPEKILRIV